MSTITTDMALAFTKELKILYAEDDLELQEQTKELFEVLFGSVTVASDGAEALAYYEQEAFDIVISDIKMPIMDGIELSTRIRDKNPYQSIIIISAYNDIEDLMKFINLNIRQFIQKPINIDNMIETLYFTAKNIVNEKMVDEYRESLEHSNKELTTKNEELMSLVRILDAKLLQIAKNEDTQTEDIDLSNADIQKEQLSELKELEIDISGAAVLVGLSKNLNLSNIQVLGKLFSSYAEIIESYEAYNKLSISIKELGETLTSDAQNFINRVDDITILLESFIYVLRMWRTKVVENEFSKAIDLHSSMINDITTIISIINGTEDDIQTDMEFF